MSTLPSYLKRPLTLIIGHWLHCVGQLGGLNVVALGLSPKALKTNFGAYCPALHVFCTQHDSEKSWHEIIPLLLLLVFMKVFLQTKNLYFCLSSFLVFQSFGSPVLRSCCLTGHKSVLGRMSRFELIVLLPKNTYGANQVELHPSPSLYLKS